MSAPYRPGQPQWPDNRPQRPERPPPGQYQQPDERPPATNNALRWTLRIAGLVAVAVVSGLVWTFVTGEDPTPPATGSGGDPTPSPKGVYDFTPHQAMPEPFTEKDCAKHAYGDIEQLLRSKPCDHLTQQLFVVDVDGKGRTVYVSVTVVTMPDKATAEELREATDLEGSGNIKDVVRGGAVKINGLDRLSVDDGYASSQKERDVIIVETAFDPKAKSGDAAADEKIVDAVSKEALLLGPGIDKQAGGG